MNKNLIQRNPNLSGSLFLSIVSIVLMLLTVPLFALIALAISSRQIYKAKKANENKKFIIVGYIFIAIPLILWAITLLFLSFLTYKGWEHCKNKIFLTLILPNFCYATQKLRIPDTIYEKNNFNPIYNSFSRHGFCLV